MTATLLPNAKQAFTGPGGIPLVGGQLFTYAAGTNTPLATYADAGGTIPNTNPIILDARGEAVVFWNGSYKVVLEDALGNLIWSVDNITGGAAQLYASAILVNKSGVPAVPLQQITDEMPLNLADFKLATEADWSNAVDRATALRPGKIIVPPGGCQLSRPFTDNPSGNYFYGEHGVANCYFNIDQTFVPGQGLGVRTIPASAAELYAGGDGVGFQFNQPANRVRGNLVQFLPAVYANNVSRMRWGHLKVSGAYNGLQFIGNCGGMIADTIEIGALNLGFAAGGSIDWWNINVLTFWPWNIAARTDLAAIYYDGTTIGLRHNRMDGMNINIFNNLSTQIITEPDSTGNAGFGYFGTFHCDSDHARWDKTNGDYQVGALYTTDSNAGTYGVYHHGDVSGSLMIASLYCSTTDTGIDPIVGQDGLGYTSIDNTYFEYDVPQKSGFYISAGIFNMASAYFGRSLVNQARTSALVHVGAGARLTMAKARFADRGTGSGLLLQVDQDDFHDINMLAPGWTSANVSIPATHPTGNYVLNKVTL